MLNNNNNTNTDEDESNVFNGNDFEEGKPKTIVTARMTPIKTNELIRKNMS